jgi:MFS family permease
MKDRSFAIFVIGSLLICIPLAFYYNFTNPFLNEMGVVNAAGKQTLGQMSEVFFMLVMPFFFRRLGVKWMLIAGMAAWATRYLLFAFGNATELVFMYYLGILLHGVCYDFFFVTGQIYVDKTAPKSIQASAQGFITLVTYGVGMLIGSWVSGPVVDRYATKLGEAVSHDWTAIWLWPASMAFVIILLFAFFFDGGKRETKTAA